MECRRKKKYHNECELSLQNAGEQVNRKNMKKPRNIEGERG
jgi:hypothetical protein